MQSSTPKPRAILSEVQAIEIFQIRLAATATPFAHPRPSPVQIASYYGVSEKTVRDIWKGRTWARETYHLDPARQLVMRNRGGRPRGSKDSKKRITSSRLSMGQLGVMRPSFDQSSFLQTEITFIDDNSLISPRQPINYGHTRQDQIVETIASVDHQLHEWAEWSSAPPGLEDPFRHDWAEWLAVSECIKGDL